MIPNTGVLKALVLSVVSVAARESSAQYLPIVPTLQPALELDDSQIGAWAEYRAMNGALESKQRLGAARR